MYVYVQIVQPINVKTTDLFIQHSGLKVCVPNAWLYIYFRKLYYVMEKHMKSKHKATIETIYGIRDITTRKYLSQLQLEYLSQWLTELL